MHASVDHRACQMHTSWAVSTVASGSKVVVSALAGGKFKTL